MYKNVNYELFNKKLSAFYWSCLYQGSVNEVCSFFTNMFIEFAKLSIPSKPIVVREDDKLWYDTEIRRDQRKRDRQLNQVIKMTGTNKNISGIR